MGQSKRDSTSRDTCLLTVFIVVSFDEARATIPHTGVSVLL